VGGLNPAEDCFVGRVRRLGNLDLAEGEVAAVPCVLRPGGTRLDDEMVGLVVRVLEHVGGALLRRRQIRSLLRFVARQILVARILRRTMRALHEIRLEESLEIRRGVTERF
jgi:hypothetical protein